VPGRSLAVYGDEVEIRLSASYVVVALVVSVDPSVTIFACIPSPVIVQRFMTESLPSIIVTPVHVPARSDALKGAGPAVAALSMAGSSFGAQATTNAANRIAFLIGPLGEGGRGEGGRATAATIYANADRL
jgi:hypothetical protein